MIKGRNAYKRAVDRASTLLVLDRIPLIDDGSGGWYEGDPVTLDPQRARISYVKPEAETTITQGGAVTKAQVQIVGDAALDILGGDKFTLDAVLFAVSSVIEDHGAGKIAYADISS
jgi:hypothetical protein